VKTEIDHSVVRCADSTFRLRFTHGLRRGLGSAARCARSLGSMKRLYALLLLVVLLPCTLFAQEKDRDWYKHAVFYEIYPRSFADSNNDGIGDLNGITAHLDYLKRLGVDAIWITPCFPSPQVDFGYDVSDYESIDPAYGTLADFDRLVAEARKRNIRVVLDFVLNHTSDRHAWFEESRSSRTSAKRDWYLWRDGAAPGQPPNNWGSVFGGSAWQLDPATGQYYLHQFYAEQPDLNWRYPEVEDAMMEVARFWFKRGVAGFRLDAVDRIYEDPDFRDNPVKVDPYGSETLVETYTTNLPELHNVLRHLRTVADEYGAVLVGETWTSSVEELQRYYNSLQMPMNFVFTMVNRPSAPEFRKQIHDAERGLGWPVYLFSNHDITRHYDRYGDRAYNDQIAKALAALYLTLRGTPILYYGEEIGMTNNDPARVEDVKDPIGRRFWPHNKGRDGERTPMQWTAGPNGGFSQTAPWLPVPDSARTHNVAAEEKDERSILRFYRHLLELRHTNEQLREGNYVALNENDANVLAYLRTYKGKAVLVAINMSAAPRKIALDLRQHSFGAKAKTLLATESQPGSVRLSEISLAPFGVYIGEVK
jgi:alpha-glucosidase